MILLLLPQVIQKHSKAVIQKQFGLQGVTWNFKIVPDL
jgi:hypothetical protein